MSLDEGRKRAEGYPPEYRAYVRKTWAWLAGGLLVSGGAALFFGLGCFHDLPPFILFSMAPLAILAFLVLLLFTPSMCVWKSDYAVCILPYFQKSHPSVAGRCSFLSGKALGRNCTYLDALAQDAGLATLSQFGFDDDLRDKRVTWHDPEHGLRAISGLRTALRQDPSLLRETDAVIADSALVEANLQDAVRLQAPFRLLLRYGSWASGHEMDVRQGYFCYSDPATFPPGACQKQ